MNDFSGPASLITEPLDCTRRPFGDIQCSTDTTTHGYWAKDDEHHVVGEEPYEGLIMLGWRVEECDGKIPQRITFKSDGEPEPQDMEFGTEWYADCGVFAVGDKNRRPNLRPKKLPTCINSPFI